MEIPPHIQPLFEGERKNAWGETQIIRRGEYLIDVGDTKAGLFFVEEGAFQILYPTRDEIFTIRLGYAPDLLAIFPTLLNGQPTEFAFQAIRKSSVRYLPSSIIEKWRKEDPKFNSHWTKALEDLIIQQFEREIDLLTPSPRERYQRILERNPRVFQHIPLKYIAAYLRMTPETLSRLRNS